MKTIKFIAILLSVILFCTALAACAGESKEQPKQDPVQDEVKQKESTEKPIDDGGGADREQEMRETEKYDYQDYFIGFEEGDDGGQNAREQEAREQEDATRPEDEGVVFPGEGDDGGQNAREQEAREQEDREREERQRQEEEQRQQEEQERQEQQTGSYEHHIGDAVFYTEHDLGKYLSPNPRNPEHYLLDLEAMLHDIWGDGIGLLVNNDGYAGTDGSSFTHAVSYNYVDGKDDAVSHHNVSNYCFAVSDTGGGKQCSSIVTIYSEEKPSGGWLIIKGDTFGFSPDAAALLLYVLEQTQYNPRSNVAGELPLPSNYECRSF